MHVHAGRGGVLAHHQADDLDPSNAPSTLITAFWPPLSSDDVHPSLAGSTVRATAPMPPMPPAPPATCLVPPAPVMPPVALPAAPPQNISYALAAGVRCPTTTPAPVQPYPICYPLGPWHPTSRTTRVHMVTVTRTPRQLNPTSSLVGTRLNCAVCS